MGFNFSPEAMAAMRELGLAWRLWFQRRATPAREDDDSGPRIYLWGLLRFEEKKQ